MDFVDNSIFSSLCHFLLLSLYVMVTIGGAIFISIQIYPVYHSLRWENDPTRCCVMKRLIDPTPLATKNGTKNAKKPDCFTHLSLPSTTHWAKRVLWFLFFPWLTFRDMIWRELKRPCIHRIGKFNACLKIVLQKFVWLTNYHGLLDWMD